MQMVGETFPKMEFTPTPSICVGRHKQIYTATRVADDKIIGREILLLVSSLVVYKAFTS